MRARHPELEAQIVRDPDDLAGYLVYADWLIEHGDPRGELIHVQSELARAPSVERREREALLLARHRAEWIGVLDQEDPVRFTWTWRYGFFRSVRLAGKYSPTPSALARLYRAMRDLPSACLLRELAIVGSTLTQAAWRELIGAIADRPLPPTLRTLSFGLEHGAFDGDLEPLTALAPQLGGLASLRLRGLPAPLGAIALPALRELELAAHAPAVEAMLGARLPALEALVLRLDDVPLALVGPLLSGAVFPALTSLALAADASVVRVLAASPVLARLRTLDLSQVYLDEWAARELLANHAAFAGLTQLRIGRRRDLALLDQLAAVLGPIVHGVHAG